MALHKLLQPIWFLLSALCLPSLAQFNNNFGGQYPNQQAYLPQTGYGTQPGYGQQQIYNPTQNLLPGFGSLGNTGVAGTGLGNVQQYPQQYPQSNFGQQNTLPGFGLGGRSLDGSASQPVGSFAGQPQTASAGSFPAAGSSTDHLNTAAVPLSTTNVQQPGVQTAAMSQPRSMDANGQQMIQQQNGQMGFMGQQQQNPAMGGYYANQG